MTRGHEWYKRNLQLTLEGVSRYGELVRRRSLGPQAASEYAALRALIVLHPLDYVNLRLPEGTRPDFEAVISRGYAEVVGDRYAHVVDTLSKYDSELLPVFQAYKKLAYEEQVSEDALDEALRILKRRALKEAGRMAAHEHLDEFVELIGEPKTRSEKVIALDAAIHKLHWDPDLLRNLSRGKQSVVGSSIGWWLWQLAGDKLDLTKAKVGKPDVGVLRPPSPKPRGQPKGKKRKRPPTGATPVILGRIK